MPKVTEEHAEARRRQIMDAALACFAREGLHRTTMQDTFREADLSPGAVYSYFAGKDELIHAIADDVFSGARVVLAELDRQGEPASLEQAFDQIMVVFDSVSGRGNDSGARAIVHLWAEASRNPDVMALVRRVVNLWRDRIGAVVRAGQARGDIDPGLDPDAVARTIVALFHGLFLQRSWYPRMDVAAYRRAARAMVAGELRR